MENKFCKGSESQPALVMGKEKDTAGSWIWKVGLWEECIHTIMFCSP